MDAIQRYVQTIHSSKDFIHSAHGQLHLDAITMRLQVIGESVKKIETAFPLFFENEVNHDVTDIIRFRDFISHHYEKLDYEIIYDICVHKLPEFKAKLENYLAQNQSSP